MLFTITRDQFQRYKDTAGPCRQYILNRFPRLCAVVDTFNRYFGPENIDVYGAEFRQKSLLLTLLEDYEERFKLVDRTLEEYLDNEFVDNSRSGLMTDLAIYVHWPNVVVTNEREQSVVVTDLYAKIPIYPDGRLYENFMLSRATYTYEQYTSDYMHSHVQGINPNPSAFMRPCLGTGPLIRTQQTLAASANNDLWDLFCVELDRYVHVESVAGVPYRYLDRIGTNRLAAIALYGQRSYICRRVINDTHLKPLFTQFFKYVVIRKKMRFSFSDGMFKSAYSDVDWILKLSKVFLKYYAMMTSLWKTNVSLRKLSTNELLIEVKVNNGTLYHAHAGSRGSSCESFRGLHVLYFKGEDIKTEITDSNGAIENSYYILNPILALTFLDQCLNYLNIYEHEKDKNIIQNNQEEGESISRNSSDSTVRNEGNSDNTSNSTSEKRIAISL